MTTWLSKHFSLEELIATQHREIDNTPPPAFMPRMMNLALRMEGVRTILRDKPISVNSGYRCPSLNTKVGGSEDSAHMKADAVDFNCYTFGTPLKVCHAIAKSPLLFDQLIEEGTWVHISFDPRMRGLILTKNPSGGFIHGLRPISAKGARR